MTKLILSSSNIMGGGASVIRRPNSQKSNVEFTAALRANFANAQHAVSQNGNGHANGGNGDAKPPYSAWTTQKDFTIYVPSVDFSQGGLLEERESYEVTVKLFFLPNKPASCRCAQTREAVGLVLRELHVSYIDLLIVSYPGISFNAEQEGDTSDDPDQGDASLTADADPESVDTMIETWECLEELHEQGTIKKLGVSEFGSDRLARFIQKARIRPSVDQINVIDCCVVPRPLILYAKSEKIELLTHADSTNILPTGTTRELLGQGPNGAGVLAKSDESEFGLKGDVESQWVIKYTAVIKNRGVIENKGYFAAAEVRTDAKDC